jgi:hypothetical protein
VSSPASARSISAFFSAMVVALICSAVIGVPPPAIWSSSSFGTLGSAAVFAAIAAFFAFVLLGIHAPFHHDMPRTQKSGHSRRRALTENREIVRAYARLIETYLNTTVEYFNKIQGHLHTENALARYYPEAALLTERVFEEIGLTATIGLSHLLWGAMQKDAQRLEGAQAVANTLAAFLKTHRISGSPCYDGQSIDVALALMFLFLMQQTEASKGWLRELSDRLTFGFRAGHWFPISTDAFDDLVELEIDRSEVDLAKLRETSWMLPILAQWMAALDVEDAYTNLVRLRLDELKDTHFQLWYPDDKTDAALYQGPAHFETGIAEAPVDLPATGEEMRGIMRRTRTGSPVKDRIASSAAKAGIGWLDFVASRHFRTPPDPAFWQNLVVPGTAGDSS